MDNKTMIKVINGIAEDIIKLSIKMDDRVKFAQIQDEKIHKLEKRNKVLEEITDIHNNKIESLNDRINTLWKVENREIDDFKKELKGIKKELDGIYKVLEITDDQIEGLIAYNIKEKSTDDFNNVMGEAHETLKRVKNNNIDINKIVDEILYKIAPEYIKNNVKGILDKHINKMENK